MKTRLLLSVFLGVVVLLSIISPVHADGIIIPQPTVCPSSGCRTPVPPICKPGACPPPVPWVAQLNIRYHRVDVHIENQLAVTHIDQVFFNPNTWPVEGTYIFPLPLDAVVKNFTLWMDGKPVQGQVLDAKQARQVYEDIVRQQNDPALLEYVGRGAVQAHIFPIPSRGERRIELEYSQVLTVENGLVRYIYPLNTEKFSLKPLEEVAINVNIKSSQPVRAVYSPSHSVDVNRKDESRVTASYEAKNVRPDKDFSLFYSVGTTEAFHLLTYRDPSDLNDPDGFFVLLLAAKPGEITQTISKDLILVLDHSGSMDGEKFRQAKAALRYILQHLNSKDRFFLLTFSSGVEMYASGLRPASEADEALAWSERISAVGSTDINRALLEAAAVVDKERPTYLIFMTDGRPTTGVTDSQNILKNFARSAPPNIRLFSFGVGYDVDTVLLDSLSQDHQGASTYVKPGEALDEILSAFYLRISTPVLTSLQLDFGKLAVYDLYPNPLPDLFAGSQMVVVGRYRQGGVVDVKVKGKVNGEPRTFTYSEQNFNKDNRGESMGLADVPRLWATRKIGYLLNKIRLQGADVETIDQIVRLSIRYGIVTPYTSYLVTETMPLGVENQRKLSEDTYRQSLSQPAPPTSGQAAVEKAAEQGALQRADSAPELPSQADQKVRTAGSRTFVYSDGVWMDTAYDPKTMKTRKVSFLSADYFTLVQNRPDIAAAIALGRRVILIADGVVYEVLAEENSSIQAQPSLTPSPPITPSSTPHPPVMTSTSTPAPIPPTSKPQALPTCFAAEGLALLSLVLLFIRRK